MHYKVNPNTVAPNAGKYNSTPLSVKRNPCQHRKLMFDPQKITIVPYVREEPVNRLKSRESSRDTAVNLINAQLYGNKL